MPRLLSTVVTAVLVLALLPTSLQVRANSLEDVISRVSEAVVVIETDQAQGSGVIVDSDGVVLTNVHVLEGASDFAVRLKSGERFEDVSVIDFDPIKDLAILKIKGFDLPVAELGNSNNVRSGQAVFAIGAPLGYSQTVSRGIISAIRDMDAGFKAIQTDAAISPGSSGGGLFNEAGELIGILAAFRADGQNLNFALPINYARGMLGQESQYSEREFAALKVRTPEFGQAEAALKVDDTLRGWLEALLAEYTDVAVEELEDEPGVFLTIGDYISILRVYDDLLIITFPLFWDEEFSPEELATLISVSIDIDYGYFGYRNGTLSIHGEMPLAGSSYEAFKTVMFGLLRGLDRTAEIEFIASRYEAMAEEESRQSTGGRSGSLDFSASLPAIARSESTQGLRTITPGDHDIAIAFDGFTWKDNLEGLTLNLLERKERHYVRFIVEPDIPLADPIEGLATLATYYVDGLGEDPDIKDVKVISSGTRTIQGRHGVWFRYSAVARGIKYFYQSSVTANNGTLLTVHQIFTKPDWSHAETEVADLLEDVRFMD